MKALPNSFPPLSLQDLGKQSAGNVIALLKSAQSSPVTLAVGAGLSASAGFPTWDELLTRIVSTYFRHWAFEEERRTVRLRHPPSHVSIAFWEDNSWNQETQHDSHNLLNTHGPLRAAKIIKQRLRPTDWSYLVRKSLYGHHTLRESDLISAVAEACVADPKIEVLSYNYDNLIERALKALGHVPNPIYNSSRTIRSRRTNITHPHGYLDEYGGPITELILGEDDYHRYASHQTGWQNMVQTRAFLRSTCLFVGLSITDPQMSRLLWQAKQTVGNRHYALLPSLTEDPDCRPKLEMLADSHLMSLNISPIRYFAGHDLKDHSRAPLLVRQIYRGLNSHQTIWS